ncbi:MAG: DUF3108 domain-containing protein [Methylophilales bacterium]|nr:DUF3108 domain-containing protein [Methylophilales bacterium]
MKKLFLILLLASFSAYAAPKKITVTYDVTRKGQPFATVNETFTQDGKNYRVESVTSGIGVYALLGKRKLTSEGEVGASGLLPKHFEQQQGDKKGASADFDWSTNTLTMNNKGKTSTAPLEPSTQDLASYAYQFMFRVPTGEEIALPITSGKKLRTYKYKIASQNEMVDEVKTLHLVNTNKNDNGEEKELWLAMDGHFIPAKIVMFDDNGAKIEQVITSLTVE